MRKIPSGSTKDETLDVSAILTIRSMIGYDRKALSSNVWIVDGSVLIECCWAIGECPASRKLLGGFHPTALTGFPERTVGGFAIVGFCAPVRLEGCIQQQVRGGVPYAIGGQLGVYGADFWRPFAHRQENPANNLQ